MGPFTCRSCTVHRMRRLVIAALRRADLLDAYFSLRARARDTRRLVRSRVGRRRFARAIGRVPVGHVVVSDGGTWTLARTSDELRDVEVRDANLRLAVELCRGAGVEHFVVPATSIFRTAVGVPADQRDGLARHLLTLDPPPHVHLLDDPSLAVALPWRHLPAARRRRITESPSLDVFVAHADRDGHGVIGRDLRCTIQLWDEVPAATAEAPTSGVVADELVAPLPNPVATSIGRSRATSDEITVAGLDVPTAPEFRWYLRGLEPPFPIDLVYTWVDGDDPAWQRRRDESLGLSGEPSRDGATSERYRSFDELRFSLRSVHQHVPWAGRIHLVTDRQVPSWLDVDHPSIRVVDHTEIFADPAALPTFSSHAIESQLHHIDGLSERYLYLNDDVLFGRLADWATYFDRGGRSRFFTSKARFAPRDPSPWETSVDNAGKNLQRHLFSVTGWAPTTKIKHTAHAQQRSLLAEMEDVFADAFKETSLSRFRSPDDVSFASAMHHRYGEATGRAQVGNLAYQYLNLAGPNLRDRLAALDDARFDALCLNDGEIEAADHERVRRDVEAFLRRRFPYPAPWELDRPGGRDR